MLPFDADQVVETLSYLLLSLVPAIFFQFSVRELQYMKKSKLIAIIILLVALCNIILTILLVQKLYLLGAALATGFSYLLGSIWINAMVFGVSNQAKYLMMCCLAFMFSLFMYFLISGWFENGVTNLLLTFTGMGLTSLMVKRCWQLRQDVI